MRLTRNGKVAAPPTTADEVLEHFFEWTFTLKCGTNPAVPRGVDLFFENWLDKSHPGEFNADFRQEAAYRSGFLDCLEALREEMARVRDLKDDEMPTPIWVVDVDKYERAMAWAKEQTAKKATPDSSVAARFTWKFTDTSLGQVQVIEDTVTGETLDVTDYKEW